MRLPTLFIPSARAAVLLLVSACFTGTSFSMSLRELRTLEKLPKQGDNYVNCYLVGVMEEALEPTPRTYATVSNR